MTASTPHVEQLLLITWPPDRPMPVAVWPVPVETVQLAEGEERL